MNTTEKIEIIFYANSVKFASRFALHVPNVGDTVMFSDGSAFSVEYLSWGYEYEPERVLIYLIELKGLK
jgi:hypothetical protein